MGQRASPLLLPLNHSAPRRHPFTQEAEGRGGWGGMGGEAGEWRARLGQNLGTGQVRVEGKVRFQRSQQLGRKRRPQSQASWQGAAGPGGRNGQPKARAALSGLRWLPGVSEPAYFQHLGM